MLHSKRRRRTPWDRKKSHRASPGSLGYIEKGIPPESAAPRAGQTEVIRLCGRCTFDSEHVTSEDLRQFMWAGLRLLRIQAQARGLSDEQVNDLLQSAFNVFHDAADSMWTTLKLITSKKEAGKLGRTGFSASSSQIPHTTVGMQEHVAGLKSDAIAESPTSRNIAVAYEEVVLTEEDAEILRQAREASTPSSGRPTRTPRRMQDR